jgi:dTDP-4-amino-4,6-dideoxygalactose transaminase
LYRELLAELAPEVQMPFSGERGTSCYHILPIRLSLGTDRIRFMEGLKAHGVQTSIHYPPVHHFQIYHEAWKERGMDLPVTEDVAAREVTLPLYPTMSEEQVKWVVQAIKETMSENTSRK